MTSSERATIVAYRLAQAQDTLDQATILSEAGKWSGVINRAYYAMFYAALALLLHQGLHASKHSGVLSLIDREFVRTGVLAKQDSVHLHGAFFARQNADYLDTVPSDPEQAKAILANADTFLTAVRQALQKISEQAAAQSPASSPS